MGGSKCSSIETSSVTNLPRCGCGHPMKMWVSNTIQNPKRLFWKCRQHGYDSCELLVWDDELDDVVAVNRHFGQKKNCKTCESMKEFGREFGKEFGREIGKEFGKKISQFVIVVSIMFVIFFAMLWKSM
ncbi:hypothetical protein QL285_062890 [Trifolium repens]|nr:hypothetical protein QL285_062890 [Trifolium repens]